MFRPESPEERPDCLIVSLDSNWLFEDMPAFFDRFFVVFPREIFQRNRNYVIDDDRVQPVGFVPSGYDFNQEEIDSAKRMLGIKNEKAVFAYFGRGPTLRAFLVDTLLEAMSQVQRTGKKIRAVLLTDREVQRPNVIGIEWLATDRDFALCLAASSCLVSHHGMPTLAKAILGNVPVISFVPDVEGSAMRSETCEVEPFKELGLCVTLPYSASPEQLKGALEEMLFGQKDREVKQEQVKYRVKGEGTVFEEVTRLVRERKAEG
jgi:UDP:flavonoid glycosyltransferase YjiC (YdhE family)